MVWAERFEMGRELGAGAFGRVVLAVERASGTACAVKYLANASAGGAAMLAREARALAAVRDPHVARVYEYVPPDDGGPAIVMEAVEGRSLKEVIAGGAMPPEAALAVLKGSLLGLAAAHDAGVVHRDYKPDNVIVSAGGTSKLIDFGIAVAVGEPVTPAGTARYMPPEQWQGDPVTPASDVYSATCVFVECVAGRPPYPAAALARLRAAHLAEPVPVELVPPGLAGLVEAGMAKERAARPPDARAFATELETVAAAAYGPDWERHGRDALAAALGGLVSAAGLAWLLGGGPAATPVTDLAVSTVVPKSGGVLAKLFGGSGASTITGAGAGAAAVLLVTGGVFTVRSVTADKPEPPVAAAAARPSLAYTNETQLRVLTPDGRDRVLATFPRALATQVPRWSPDGRLVAWRRDAPYDDANRTVLVADAATGRTSRLPLCATAEPSGCAFAGFLGDDLVATSTTEAAPKLRLMPATGGTVREVPLRGLPKAPQGGTWSTVQPVGIVGGSLIAALDASDGGADDLYSVLTVRIDASGTVSPLFPGSAHTLSGGQETVCGGLPLYQDDRALMMRTFSEPFECGGGDPPRNVLIRVIDLENRKVVEGIFDNGGVEILQAFRDPEGRLCATAYDADLGSRTPRIGTRTIAPAKYCLTGGRFTLTTPGLLLDTPSVRGWRLTETGTVTVTTDAVQLTAPGRLRSTDLSATDGKSALPLKPPLTSAVWSPAP
ncbi:protein kinase domain-containing protein [Actinocorallia longicatena]|uniref:Protein kinase domain-containing protein n=1 Tax=Actinocorallia longicatena TaxID=111803 RepID=A0ABP6QRA1_9ACTN